METEFLSMDVMKVASFNVAMELLRVLSNVMMATILILMMNVMLFVGSGVETLSLILENNVILEIGLMGMDATNFVRNRSVAIR